MPRLEQLVERMRAHGLRITPQRREIIKTLLEQGGHLTAQEVYNRLRSQFPDLSLDTVYRTLRTLAVLGIVCQLHLQTAHASKFGLLPDGHHHHHLVCIDCGDMIEVFECPLPGLVEKWSEQHGFEPAGHAFEIYGFCGPCQKQRAGEQ